MSRLSARARATALLGGALSFVALAAPPSALAAVTLYTQPDDSGEMASPQATFQDAHIDSASLGDLNLGKGALSITFTLQAPNASNSYGQPGGVALGSCAGCTDLQTYRFSDDDRTLLTDGVFHTFLVKTGTTTIGLADGTNPIFLTFFNLPQFQGTNKVKSDASSTLPAITIQADIAPSPPFVPTLPSGTRVLYAQKDASGSMANTQPTFQDAHIDSASLGNLNLWQGPLYLIFSMQSPNVDEQNQQPGGVCLTPAGGADCLQTYYFTNDDRALLADHAFHSFLVETGTTTSAYADGTAPVGIRFFSLPQFQGATKVKSDTAGTLPALTIATLDPCATPGACVSSVLFIPGTEASRLYMRNSDGSERKVWEPSFASDISLLAMKPDGTSVNAIYAKDIVDSVYGDLGPVARGVAHLNPTNFEVYGDFEQFMNDLAASSTFNMRQWRAYPYDWRYDVRDIVANGTDTEEPDGSRKRVYLEDVITEMASSSATGKVTIVAHSNGGLVAKALMQKLTNDGKGSMVDQLIMIGTPQWGTPVDIGSMLHGDGQTRGLGIISYGEGVRVAAANMPGPYDLLPSSAYFAQILNPVATFADDDLAGPFVKKFSGGITSFIDLVAFVTNAFNLDATSTEESLNTPLALIPDLVAKAQATHAQLDAWQAPADTRVTSLVGWGQLTTFTYRYAAAPGHALCEFILGKTLCSRPDALVHEAIKTEDGDDTVVSPSAAGNTGSVWYFDAKLFKHDGHGSFVHQDLTSATPIQNTILDLLEGRPVSESYIVSTKPPATKNPLHVISGRSPINLLATDAEGNETGIVPVPGTDFYIAKHDIPGSAVDISGEEKFIYLPQGESYSIGVSGYAAGPANLEVQNLDADGNLTQTTTLADIPVVAGTTGLLTLSSDNTLSSLSLDLDGDGTADASIAPTAGALTSYEPPPPAPPTPSLEPPPPPSPVPTSGGGGGGVFLAPPPPPTPPPPAPAAAPAPPAVSAAPAVEPPASSPVASEPSTSVAPAATHTTLTLESATPQSVMSTVEEQSAHDKSYEKSAAVSSQAASAYAGLSEARHSGVAGRVYHWINLMLNQFLHTLSEIL